MDPDEIIGGTGNGPDNDLIDPTGNQDPATPPDPDSGVTPPADGTTPPADPNAPAPTMYKLPDGREVDEKTAIAEFQKFYPDYTRKAQEAKRASELETQNKQLTELLNNFKQPNPNQQNMTPEEIEARQVIDTLQKTTLEQARTEIMPQIEQLKVQNECISLKSKYADFDQDSVLQFALENKMAHNLEAAYMLLNREAHIEKARKDAETATTTNMTRKGPAGVVGGSSNSNPGASGLKPYNPETDSKKSFRELMNEGMAELGLR